MSNSGQAGRRSAAWLRAALIALLLQSLYPPGLMPGSLDDGWFASLCPKGLPMGFAHRLGLHGAHHESHGENATLGDCQLGNAVEQPLGEFSVPRPLPQDEGTALFAVPRTHVAAATRIRFHEPRAPPSPA